MDKTNVIEYILPRKTPAEFEQMNCIYRVCVENFGKSDFYSNWSMGWADDTDDWVKFTFYQTDMALFIKIKFPELITLDDWNYRQSMDIVSRYL